MILIYVSEITSRVEYTFNFIFKLRGIEFELTSDRLKFNSYSDSKLNYSSEQLDGYQILPNSICFEDTIELKEVLWTKSSCLSINGNEDYVASIFYLLSRYEEYTCTKRDDHGRFTFSESILAQENKVERLNCDRWAEQVIRLINDSYLKEKTEVSIIPTFDIDNTFAYKLKTGKRMILSLLRDVFKGDKKRIRERSEVLNGAKDPFDTYEYIAKIGAEFPGTLLFWLVGDRAKLDRNISIQNKQHQAVIKSMDDLVEVNLHPSYASQDNVEIINKEKEELSQVVGREIHKSRQHFLRLKLPDTYRSLLAAGFNEDYTMGFAEHVGFRSGTARVHFWFDLGLNEVTPLKIHPFAYMDGTLNEYMNLTIEQSKSQISSLFKEVKEFGGDFIFLWHNETIGDYGKWKGWSSVLDYTLNLKDE